MLGPTSTILNGKGEKLWEDRFYPFGDIRYTYRKDDDPDFPVQTDYRYTGQRLDAGVGATATATGLDRGLYFYNSRYFDSTLARFLQTDTIVPEPGNPQALNRYAYVNNNPIKYRDPSGHWGETAWDIANIAWDIHEVRQDPSLLNWGALVVDVGAAVLPFVPAGAGLVVRGGKAAKIGVEIATHGDEVVDAVRVAGHMGDGVHAVLSADLLVRAGKNSPAAIAYAKALAKQGTKGDLTKGVVSLGHFRQYGDSLGYVDWEKKTGAAYLDLDSAAAESLISAGKWWDVNKQFLDDAIEAGTSFHLQRPKALKADSFFQQEIDYLIGRGYQLFEEGGGYWLRLPQ